MEESIIVFGQSYLLIFISSLLLAPEAVLFVTAAMTDQPPLAVLVIILVVSIGGSIGSAAIYFLSAMLGEKRLFKLVGKLERYYLLNSNDLVQIFGYFERKGHWLVFFGRMAPTVRTIVSIPPGIIHMNFRVFLTYTFMGTLVWNLIIGYVFYYFWVHAEAISSLLGAYAAVSLGVIILLAVWLVGRNIARRLMNG